MLVRFIVFLHQYRIKLNVAYKMSTRNYFSGEIQLYGKDGPDSPALIDIWSLLHLLNGCGGYIITTKCLGLTIKEGFILFNIVHLLYEFKDWYLTYIEKYHERSCWSGRSFVNSITDLIFGMVGYIFFAQYYDKISRMSKLSAYQHKIIFILYLALLNLYLQLLPESARIFTWH
jgi:hypothetical protein